MQLHEKKGKHGAPVTCGDWLFDNRLGLASGLRVMPDLAPPAQQGIATKSPCAAGGQPAPSQVKISQPVAETSAKWESYSKFRLGGMLSKVRGPQPRPRGRTQPEAWSHPRPHLCSSPTAPAGAEAHSGGRRPQHAAVHTWLPSVRGGGRRRQVRAASDT